MNKLRHICDNSFLCQFSRVSRGSLLENAVFNNLRKYGNLAYYQKRSGGEIDFILDSKTALEVKTKGTLPEYIYLEKIARKLNLKEYFVITKDFNPNPGFIPAEEF